MNNYYILHDYTRNSPVDILHADSFTQRSQLVQLFRKASGGESNVEGRVKRLKTCETKQLPLQEDAARLVLAGVQKCCNI